MLSLILPPILLVLILVFLTYFFSRRLPVLEARLDQKRRPEATPGSAAVSVWKDRLKQGILGFLETLTRFIHQTFLRAYNLSRALTNIIRRKREAGRARLTAATAARESRVETSVLQKEGESSKLETPVSDSVTLLPHTPHSPMLREPVRPSRSVATAPSVAPTRLKKEQLEELLIERIVANPRDVEAYERLGDYYLEREVYADAKECYRQVLKLSPVNRLVKIKIRRLERILEKD